MSEQFDPRSTDLKAWMLLHRTRDLAFFLQDRICSEYGLSLEQYSVLVGVKYSGGPIGPVEVGRWLGHKGHTLSMITDRMVRAGLLERFRDLPDRRFVRFTITEKGEQAFKRATRPLWAFVQATMSSLSPDEKSTLVELLEKIRNSELQNLPAAQDPRLSPAYEAGDPSLLIKRLGKYARTPKAKPRSAPKAV